MRVVERSRNFRLDVWVLAALLFYVLVPPQWQQFKETKTGSRIASPLTPWSRMSAEYLATVLCLEMRKRGASGRFGITAG